ncbi:hypothetical protein [Streptomyces sp. DSM 41634]|uniref:hypothetical protein n=1 Tax=Streptomyces sp. DSM 41634 TaxID=3448656 RepID=UPI00403FD29A
MGRGQGHDSGAAAKVGPLPTREDFADNVGLGGRADLPLAATGLLNPLIAGAAVVSS